MACTFVGQQRAPCTSADKYSVQPIILIRLRLVCFSLQLAGDKEDRDAKLKKMTEELRKLKDKLGRQERLEDEVNILFTYITVTLLCRPGFLRALSIN